ncbi:hypothetical protein QQF64_026690 [Cirrhinus molitorella]|uniref:Uncharacterized protein n=1 Tax=Cirrhinus molitorella TaxID=172907 RepID=A0ABR3NAW8_9TELE
MRTHTQTRARTHPPADRDCASENMLHQAEKQAKISVFFKRSQGAEDDNTCSAASSSQCSFPTLSQSREKSPSAACPAPDKQQKSSHHRMTGFDPAWLSEGKYSPWLYKTDLGK